MNGYIKRSAWIAATLFGWVMMPSLAQAASFDCAKALSTVEKLICGDSEISKLNEELNAAYKTALQDGKQSDTVKQAQKKWMKERNGCRDLDCLKTAYQVRINQLADASMFSVAPSRLKMMKGKGVEVCEIYQNNLDALGNPDLSCERKISLGYDEKIKLPVWAALDIWEKRNLMAQAGKFLDYGSTDRKDTVYDNQKNVDDTASTQLRLKGTTMMISSIDIDNDGVNERILRYQSGICGLARYSYTTTIMVLDNTSDTVDTKKSQLLYPDIWINPKTGEKVPTRDYHYVTYGVFSFAGKTYFDRMRFDGSLAVHKILDGSNEEVCKFNQATK